MLRSYAIRAAAAAWLAVAGGLAWPWARPAGFAAEPVRIRVGLQQVAGDAPLYLAAERGYFREQGLAVEFQGFRATSEQIPLLATGHLDLGTGTLNAALINAVAQGVPIRLVADKGNMRTGHATNVLLVRRSLWSTGDVRQVADLRGRRVATIDPEGGSGFLLDRLLASGGIGLADVDVVRMLVHEMPGALASGAVDGALVVEPLVTVAVRTRAAVVLVPADKVLPNFPLVFMFYGPRLLRDRELGVRFMQAFLRGVQDYAQALAAGGPQRQAVVDILMRYTPLRDPGLYSAMTWPAISEDGRFSVDYIRAVQEFLLRRGSISRALEPEELVDFTYADLAMAQIARR